MKQLVRRLSWPLLVLAGAMLMMPQTADAARWRRYYVGPRAVYGRGIGVYAPGVSVQIGPGVRVRAPGVGVYVGRGYRYYGRPYFYGW